MCLKKTHCNSDFSWNEEGNRAAVSMKVGRLIKSHPEWKRKCLQCCKLKLQLRQIKTMSIAEVSRQIYENEEVLCGTRMAARRCQVRTVKKPDEIILKWIVKREHKLTAATVTVQRARLNHHLQSQ